MSELTAPVPLPLAGVHVEIHPNELPPTALADSQNWILRDGRMRVREGLETIGADTNDRPNGFVGYRDDAGTAVLLMGTDDTVFVFDDATQAWVDLSASFTAGILESTLFEVFSLGAAAGPATTVYIQNGIDRPKKWTYGDATVTNINAPPTAKAMMLLADRLILGNLIDHASSTYNGAVGPSVITASANQNPEAGYDLTDGLVAQLLDTPGEIVAMQEIGNLQGVVYKTDAIYLITAAVNTPFTVELKKSGTPGPVSPRAVVRASDGLQYYLARDGNVMVFDGVEPKPLGRHIQRYILNTWDFDASFRAHGVYDDENRELRFFYSGTGSAEPNVSIIVRLDDASLWPQKYDTLRITAAIKAALPGGTTIGQLSGAISAQTLTLGEYDALGQTMLFGESGGQAYGEGGHLDDAASIQFYFETGSTDFGHPRYFKSPKYIDHLFSLADDTQAVSVTLMRSNYGEELELDGTRILQIGSAGPYTTFHRFPGRKHALKISGDASNAIEWQGATVGFALQGTR